MIDTHCHLTDKKLVKDIVEVIDTAHTNDIETLITLGIDVASSQEAIKIASSYEGIYTAAGIHPSEIAIDENERSDQLQSISSLLTDEHVVAVGETGLDAQYAYAVPLEIQRENLIQHIQLAVQHNKTLVIHSRGTMVEVLQLFTEYWDHALTGRTVFHCCEPKQELLNFAQKYSVYLGVDGDVTYDTTKQEFIKNVPLSLLVLETDSPYLLPEPLRSQKKFPNVPANLTYVSQKVAELKNTSIQEIEEQTDNNARQLFYIH